MSCWSGLSRKLQRHSSVLLLPFFDLRNERCGCVCINKEKDTETYTHMCVCVCMHDIVHIYLAPDQNIWKAGPFKDTLFSEELMIELLR